MKGKWAGLGVGRGSGIDRRQVQAGGSSPGGAGKPLRSRPMISLTVKEGQLRDWARSNSPPLPGTPPIYSRQASVYGASRLLLRWVSVSPMYLDTCSQSNLAQLPSCGAPRPPCWPFPAGLAACNARAITVSRARGGVASGRKERPNMKSPHHQPWLQSLCLGESRGKGKCTRLGPQQATVRV